MGRPGLEKPIAPGSFQALGPKPEKKRASGDPHVGPCGVGHRDMSGLRKPTLKQEKKTSNETL